MASKTISLSESTYERLARAKGPDESFSDVINRLLREEDHPLYGLVGLLDEEELKRARERTEAFRGDVDDRLGVGSDS